MPRVSLADIARRLGVSVMTVSRGLRGQPGVSEPLRQRVCEAAAELGYRPDPEIGRLMQRLRYADGVGAGAMICAVTDFPSTAEPKYNRRLHEHAARRAEELGYRFGVVRATGRTGWRAALRTVRARGAEGLLISPLMGPGELAGEDWASLAVVAATSSVRSPQFHEVVPNHAANARLVVERLVETGYRRLGFVALAAHVARTRESFPAALAWHHSQQRLTCAPLMYEAGRLPDVVAWLRREEPDVVIVGRIADLPHLRSKAEAAGIRLPWVLANSRAFYDEGPGLDECDDLIGTTAVDLLSRLLMRGERGVPAVPTSVAIQGRWVASAGPTLG